MCKPSSLVQFHCRDKSIEGWALEIRRLEIDGNIQWITEEWGYASYLEST